MSNKKSLITNKSLLGATNQYMELVTAVEGGGLRKEYLLHVVTEIKKVSAEKVGDALKVTIEPLKVDSRYNRNILAFINACIKLPVKAKEALKDVDETIKFDDLLALGRGLKGVKKDGEKDAKKDVKKTVTGTAEKVSKVDVKDVLDQTKNEFINHSKELLLLSKEELTNNILELLIQVDNLDYSKMSKEKLSVIQNHLEQIV